MTFLRNNRLDPQGVDLMLALLPPDLQAALETMDVIEITTLDGRKMVILREDDFNAYLEALTSLARTIHCGKGGTA